MDIKIWGVGSGLCERKNTSAQINGIQIDAGPSVYQDILNHFPEHLLITHPHGDHIGGIWHVALFAGFKSPKPLHIYGSSLSIERIKHIIREQSDHEAYQVLQQKLHYHILPEKGSITINNTKIDFETRHHIAEIHTHIFKFNDKVVWATDIHETEEDFPFYQGTDLVFHVMYRGKAHTTPEMVARIMKRAHVPRVLGIHYCDKKDLTPYAKDFQEFRYAEEGESFHL
ncbi:MAG: hypothetical protein GXN92_02685 [Candidatus Micrarchaeota archaeon]|nr:hypothetical protein [Candidatus Micrarchaeota archaeon]